jgi:hypothetical protein
MTNLMGKHTHKVFLDSKDKVRFHQVGRLEMGTKSCISNLALSITAYYPRF